MTEHCLLCGRDEAKYMVGEFSPVHRHCGRILQNEAENAKRIANRAVRAEAQLAQKHATLPTQASEAPIAANLSQAGFTEVTEGKGE